MESTSQETNTPSQPNDRPSLSALADFMAKQEQFFEQSLMSQQLRAKQIADEQEAKIKEAAKKITMGAAEIEAIRKGENIVTSEVKPEGINSERWAVRNGSLNYIRHLGNFRDLPLLQYPETGVYKEHRRYSPEDHVSKRDLGNLNSDSRYDHDKDHQRPRSGRSRCRLDDGRGRNYPRLSKSPDDDTNPRHVRSVDSRKHRERRGASPSERSWKRERSPSKSKPRRYCHEGPDSAGDSRGRIYHTAYKRPVGDGIPRDRKSIDSGKHRERRDASPLESSRKRERRSPSKPERWSYRHEDSHPSRYGSSRYQSDDGIPQDRKSIDSGKHRERRDASPLESSRKRERRSPSQPKRWSYRHEDSHPSRYGSSRYRSGDSRAKDYRRACRSTDGDSNPHPGKSIDSRKHREKRGASPLGKSKHLSAEDQKDCSGSDLNEKTSKRTADVNTQNHTSETLDPGKDETRQKTPSKV